MKKLASLVNFLFVFVHAYSQQVFAPRIGLSLGGFSGLTDIRSVDFKPTFSNKIGWQFYAEQQVANPLVVSLNFSTGKIYGNQVVSGQEVNFSTSLVSQSIRVAYNLQPFFNSERVNPQIGMGVGVLNFRSKGDLKNSKGILYSKLDSLTPFVPDRIYESDLRQANLDRFGKYPQTSLVLPFFAAVDVKLIGELYFRINAEFQMTFSDMLDNISSKGSGPRKGKPGFDQLIFAAGGLNYHFNKSAVEKMQLLDSDADGVADKTDKCDRTPAGVRVNEKGCPVDDNSNGIADYLEKGSQANKDYLDRRKENLELAVASRKNTDKKKDTEVKSSLNESSHSSEQNQAVYTKDSINIQSTDPGGLNRKDDSLPEISSVEKSSEEAVGQTENPSEQTIGVNLIPSNDETNNANNEIEKAASQSENPSNQTTGANSIPSNDEAKNANNQTTLNTQTSVLDSTKHSLTNSFTNNSNERVANKDSLVEGYSTASNSVLVSSIKNSSENLTVESLPENQLTSSIKSKESNSLSDSTQLSKKMISASDTIGFTAKGIGLDLSSAQAAKESFSKMNEARKPKINSGNQSLSDTTLIEKDKESQPNQINNKTTILEKDNRSKSNEVLEKDNDENTSSSVDLSSKLGRFAYADFNKDGYISIPEVNMVIDLFFDKSPVYKLTTVDVQDLIEFFFDQK